MLSPRPLFSGLGGRRGKLPPLEQTWILRVRTGPRELKVRGGGKVSIRLGGVARGVRGTASVWSPLIWGNIERVIRNGRG